jgi:uncharacterized membrane protein
LLWITLRRFGDVLLTLVPLLLAGVVTLEICVLIQMPLNFANIIALPLLLGIGVAFKIYFVMAWRSGHTKLLQSSLTRAVIFSAATTATAFGSLWLSSHPGTSSMGKLLTLSLACTLAAAVLFQPASWVSPARSPGRVAIKSRRTQAEWPAIHRELKRPGVTLRLLWEEHRAAHPEGHGYSRFCELFETEIVSDQQKNPPRHFSRRASSRLWRPTSGRSPTAHVGAAEVPCAAFQRRKQNAYGHALTL